MVPTRVRMQTPDPFRATVPTSNGIKTVFKGSPYPVSITVVVPAVTVEVSGSIDPLLRRLRFDPYKV